MSVETTIASVEGDIKSFWSKFKSDATKAKAIWAIISSPQTRAAMVAVFNAAVVAVKGAVAAVEADGINITLDATLFTDIKALIAAAEAGDGVIKSDLAAVGIIL
jgi:hypothetical protein